MSGPQTFKNHAKFNPVFHFVVMPLLLLNLIWTIRHVVQIHSWGNGEAVLLALGLCLLAFSARIMALGVQDRVIRLEMRLRLAGILPTDLQARIPELSIHQLVALRFASDAELAGLTRRVLEERLESRKAIKMMVQDWQADELRA